MRAPDIATQHASRPDGERELRTDHDHGDGHHQRGRLRELAWLFLTLGTTALGGPAAHIATMEEQVVRRRGWLSEAAFLDLLGATNLIPGPNSTEMALHIGHHRAGWRGLLVAGCCFILPAALVTLGCAWFYTRFGRLPAASAVLHGVKPVIIAVVVQALWALGRSAVKSRPIGALAAIAALAVALGVNELLVLLLAGLLSMALTLRRPVSVAVAVAIAVAIAIAVAVAIAVPWAVSTRSTTSALAATPTAFSLSLLFATFLKIGSVLFGSGYVLLAFLRDDFVSHLGWLSESQLLDAVAVGQITPGPVFTTATFVGYLVGGVPAAGLATLGIFLPAFVFVAISGPLVPRLRRSPLAGAFLDGVNAASLALMAVVTVQLARAAIHDLPTALLALLAAALLLRYRVGSLWLLLGGALAGVAMGALGALR